MNPALLPADELQRLQPLRAHLDSAGPLTMLSRRFDATAGAVIDDIAAIMDCCEDGLRGIAAARDAPPTLAQVKRHAPTSHVDKEFRNDCGFGLIWRVVPHEKAAIVIGASATVAKCASPASSDAAVGRKIRDDQLAGNCRRRTSTGVA